MTSSWTQTLAARTKRGDCRFQQSPQYGSPEAGFTEPLGLWDKFQIFHGVRRNTPYIQIGRQRRRTALQVAKYRNPLKQALEYQSLLDAGEADSQSELARLCSTPRTTISAYLRLLDLSEEVRAEALSVADDDDRISVLTEARLRHLVGRKSKEQQKRLRDLLKQGGAK